MKKLGVLISFLILSAHANPGVKYFLDEAFVKSDQLVRFIGQKQYQFEDDQELDEAHASFIYQYFAHYHQVHPITKSSATDYNLAMAGDYAGSIGLNVAMEERGHRVLIITEKKWRRDLYKRLQNTIKTRVSQMAGLNPLLRLRLYERSQAKDKELKTIMIYIEKISSRDPSLDSVADQALEQLIYTIDQRVQMELGTISSVRVLSNN